MRAVFHIRELDCADEVAILRRQLEGAPGLNELNFDIVNSKMSVEYDSRVIVPASIVDRIAGVGMHASLWNDAPPPELWWSRHGRLLLTLIGGSCLILGMLLHLAHGATASDVFHGSNLPWPARCLYSLAIVAGSWFVLPRAWISLRTFRPDMNLLMTLAVIGAVLLGDWLEAATTACLFSLALVLEQWSLARARRAIRSLLDLSPAVARVHSPNGLREVPVAEISVGATVVVRPNERIPMDGRLVAGESHVNEAPITGESRPLLKQRDAELFAGTINGEGTVELLVTKPAGDTVLARMARLVEEAHGRRAPTEQWIERFARYYTPAMFLLALLTACLPPLLGASGSLESWIYRGLVVLVIACPCALVIATPVSIVSALTSAARQGVLVKGGLFLEVAARLRSIALDKTGTLTEGVPAVQELLPQNGHTSAELLERAAALEVHSTHPLARAILIRAREQQVIVTPAAAFRELSGRGAEGEIAGRKFWIGSHRLSHERQAESPEVHARAVALEDAGHSVVAVGNDNHVCGLISLADGVRPASRPTIELLRQLGVERIVMLTGDNEPTARGVAEATGITELHAEMLPEEKLQIVERLRRECGPVSMIGDGANDAAAMAASDLGVAMGHRGTDAAVETADVVLMADDLQRLPWLISHARRTLRIIHANATFALGLKLLFVILTWFGIASLWLAIAADTGATLLVVANALRLLSPTPSPHLPPVPAPVAGV